MLPPLRGHDDWIRSVAFSLDGTKIVSGSDDKTIRLWDASTGVEVLPPLRGHDDWIRSDASTGVEILPPLGHDTYIRCVAFSPDGSKTISGSEDKTIRVWDASTGVEILPPLRGHDGWVRCVAFSPDGSKIVPGSYDKTLRVWDASTGIEMLPPLRGHDDLIHYVAFSPDGSKIISGSFGGIIQVWDACTGIVLLPPQITADDSPGPALGEPMIRVWWLTTGRCMGALPVGARFHPARIYGSTYVGWTVGYNKLCVPP
ncbi:hypothetical protein AX14_012546 [Amanita brunnescens Koide BX004]|nr:hypothetical protein AX14_012546 [Amanita brunnescens Koide BX004]